MFYLQTPKYRDEKSISKGMIVYRRDKMKQMGLFEDLESDGKKFKHGDRVFHKNLEQYGIFISYAWESDEECDVEFIDDDGNVEQKHVSINQLKLAN